MCVHGGREGFQFSVIGLKNVRGNIAPRWANHLYWSWPVAQQWRHERTIRANGPTESLTFYWFTGCFKWLGHTSQQDSDVIVIESVRTSNCSVLGGVGRQRWSEALDLTSRFVFTCRGHIRRDTSQNWN